VDHIASRWAARRAAAGWVCAGASSRDFVLVFAQPPGSACAGCAHPRDEDITGEIPTISSVSLWAGLIQALELAAAAGRPPASARTTRVWPFGLETPRHPPAHPGPCARMPRRLPSLGSPAVDIAIG